MQERIDYLNVGIKSEDIGNMKSALSLPCFSVLCESCSLGIKVGVRSVLAGADMQRKLHDVRKFIHSNMLHAAVGAAWVHRAP